MNTTWRNGILTAVLIGLTSLVATAANNNVQMLSDKELAKVTGGFCPFYTCETGAPSGNCQPFPPNLAGLCLARTCTLVTEQLGNTQVVGCVLAGKVTCRKMARIGSAWRASCGAFAGKAVKIRAARWSSRIAPTTWWRSIATVP
jgi:hypothetical protein